MKKILTILPLLYLAQVSAQETLNNQWNKIEFEKDLMEHQIPMYLNNFDSVNVGNSSVSYFNQNNNFKDVYTAKKREGFNINSERFVNVKDWKFYGKFSFSKYEDKQTGFTTMANPYRDNPYKFADSITSADWKKQHYLIQANIITPEIIKNLKAGVGIKYEVLNGARQIDPRPSDKLVDIQVTPQMMYQLGHWDFGVSGIYNRFREDLSITMQNIQRPKDIYKLLGLGEYLYNQPINTSSSMSRMYQGDTYGGGITISKKINDLSSLQLSGTYKKVKEETTDGTTKPYNAGDHSQNVWNGLISYQYKKDNYNHLITLNASRADAENREYVQSLNLITEQYDEVYNAIMHYQVKNSIAFRYGLQIYKDQNADWNLGFGMTYNYNDEQYPTTYSRIEMEDYVINANIKKFFKIKDANLSVGYNTIYKVAGDNLLRYQEDPNFKNFVARNIVNPNFAYQTTNYWVNQIEAQYVLPAFKKSDAQLYFKLNYQNVTSTKAYQNNEKGLSNNNFNLTIGLLN